MSVIPLLAVAALAAWAYRRLQHRPGAGASADARARQLRTPLVRLATLLGIDTEAERTARRYAHGAEGERRTAAHLESLRLDGWTVLHDRGLPRGRANVDHLLISPTGVVIMPDSKRWSARWTLRAVGGRLIHDNRDVTKRLSGVVHEATAVAGVLGVPVIPLVVMHGAPVAGDQLVVDGIRIVPAGRMCTDRKSVV